MAVRAPGGLRELVNLQVVSGMAKPYQVRQFIRLVETFYSLEEVLQARDAQLAAAREHGESVP